VIDLSTNPEQGESFFGLGTIDVRAVVPGLKAGQAYDLELRISNGAFVARGSPYRCWGGIRMGGIRQINDDEAIDSAVKLAKDSDSGYDSSITRHYY
jgi:beta-glucosidase